MPHKHCKYPLSLTFKSKYPIPQQVVSLYMFEYLATNKTYLVMWKMKEMLSANWLQQYLELVQEKSC